MSLPANTARARMRSLPALGRRCPQYRSKQNERPLTQAAAPIRLAFQPLSAHLTLTEQVPRRCGTETCRRADLHWVANKRLAALAFCGRPIYIPDSAICTSNIETGPNTISEEYLKPTTITGVSRFRRGERCSPGSCAYTAQSHIKNIHLESRSETGRKSAGRVCSGHQTSCLPAGIDEGVCL